MMPEDVEIAASRNPYHTNSGKPEFQKSVFVWMDILGYRDMVKEARKSGQEEKFLSDLFDALSEARGWLDDSKMGLPPMSDKDLFALKAFTDNIVIGFPIYDDGESESGQAFGKAAKFQSSMANRGFFVRGAISVGDVYIDDIAVVGTALTEAYEAEAALARDPRIILSASAVEIVKMHLGYYKEASHSPQARDLLQDSDGQWFLNYLDEVLIAEYEQGPFYEVLEQHKLAVEKKLNQYRNNPPIFAKYAWVAGYHNFFCDLHSNWFSEEHKINAELFRAKPKLICE